MNFYKISRRCLSRSYSSRHSEVTSPFRLISEDSFVDFKNSWPKILGQTLMKNEIPEEVKERLKRVTDYTLSGGNYIRPTLTLLAFDILGNGNCAETTTNEIRTLAWGSEIVHSYFTILNDFNNDTKSRDGKPSWHTLPDVMGMHFLNDAALLKSLLGLILKDNFGAKRSYVDLKDLFDNAIFNTSIGLYLDLKKDKTCQNFTMNRYNTIVDFKTTYNTFKLPIFLAMKLSQITDEKTYSCVENLCTDIGKLFQMQIDYKDCFAGDYGTTIPNGKHSWFAISALQRCTPAQRIVFTSCYGSPEPAHIERIQQLYVKLQLPQLYIEAKQKLAEEIRKNAYYSFSKLTILKPELFLKLLDAINTD